MFGLSGRLGADPALLSQGEQRKLQCVCALLKDADVYIFDEPLANVDGASKRVIMEEIARRTEGRTLILILHGEQDFRVMFDRELALDEDGDVHERVVNETVTRAVDFTTSPVASGRQFAQ